MTIDPLARCRDVFNRVFGRPPQAIARAPGRVNLLGDHTDYNEGFVLPMAIEAATLVACAGRDDRQVTVHSDALGDTAQWPAGAWSRPTAPHWTAYVAGVDALLRARGARLTGMDVLIQSDVPLGGGLSSSAALEVAAALAFAHLAGEPLETRELIDLARAAEHEFAGVPCGIMDQTAALLGRRGSALLLDCRSRAVEYVSLPAEARVVVVDSGVRHELAQSEYARRQEQCRAALAYFQSRNAGVRSLRDVTSELVRSHAQQLDPLLAARAMHVATENERTQSMAAALADGDLAAAGSLMNESHRSLRDDFEVSCREQDQLCRIVGAVGGVAGVRMTGGGFGGSVVALTRGECLAAIEAAVRAGYPGKARIFATQAGDGARVLA